MELTDWVKVGTESHPVWTLYDKLRSTCLSCKYYGRQLAKVERQNFLLEIILAASAPTSAIAGLFFWKTPTGALVWQGFGLLAAVVAVVKPLLHLPRRIKEYESQLSAYRTLDADLRDLRSQVEQRKRFDAPMQAEFKKLVQREKALIAKNPDPVESESVRRVCQEEVLRELPADRFYIPPGDANA